MLWIITEFYKVMATDFPLNPLSPPFAIFFYPHMCVYILTKDNAYVSNEVGSSPQMFVQK